MRKHLLTAGLIVVLLALTAIPAITDDGENPEPPDEQKVPPSKTRGKSFVGHLLLVKKDADWIAMWPGTFGILKYNLNGSTFDFVFNGHGLEPKTGYSLIYYADPWPGNHPGALIDSGMTTNGGNLHLRGKGSVDLGIDLPHPDDENHPSQDPDLAGAKIWLVLSSDYEPETNSMTAWNPDAYLFEYDRIFYDDTDVPSNDGEG